MLKVVKLSNTNVDLRREGPSEFMVTDLSGARKTASGTVLWDPGVAGVLGGEVEQNESGGHDGERHLDGDELLYVISGAITVRVEMENGDTTDVLLHSGDATLVPKGHWHRLLINEPSRYLFFGGGRTEIRLPI